MSVKGVHHFLERRHYPDSAVPGKRAKEDLPGVLVELTNTEPIREKGARFLHLREE